MSKSTPIAQLPLTQDAQLPVVVSNQQQHASSPGFVNDQQRQLVQQAQQAQQQFQAPCSSQALSDVGQDDDATLREVFNSFGDPDGAAAAAAAAQHPQHIGGLQAQPIVVQQYPVPQQQQQQYVQQYPAQTYVQPTPSFSYIREIRDALIAAGLIFVIGLLPVSPTLLSKYISFPHSELAIKAILSAIVVLAAQRYAASSGILS